MSAAIPLNSLIDWLKHYWTISRRLRKFPGGRNSSRCPGFRGVLRHPSDSDVWLLQRQTYSYLASCRSSSPFGHSESIPLSSGRSRIHEAAELILGAHDNLIYWWTFVQLSPSFHPLSTWNTSLFFAPSVICPMRSSKFTSTVKK